MMICLIQWKFQDRIKYYVPLATNGGDWPGLPLVSRFFLTFFNWFKGSAFKTERYSLQNKGNVWIWQNGLLYEKKLQLYTVLNSFFRKVSNMNYVSLVLDIKKKTISL